MHSKIPFHFIIARLHCPVHAIGCHYLQNRCQLHYHTADSILTSGWDFIIQHIWIGMFIALAILGLFIIIEKFSAGKRILYIQITGWNRFNFGSVTSLIATCWQRWCTGRMWHEFRCWLSELVWWRCICAFAPPACLRIKCCAILQRMAAICLIFPKYSQVAYHWSLPISMARKLNSPHLLFSNFGLRWFN